MRRMLAQTLLPKDTKNKKQKCISRILKFVNKMIYSGLGLFFFWRVGWWWKKIGERRVQSQVRQVCLCTEFLYKSGITGKLTHACTHGGNMVPNYRELSNCCLTHLNGFAVERAVSSPPQRLPVRVFDLRPTGHIDGSFARAQ